MKSRTSLIRPFNDLINENPEAAEEKIDGVDDLKDEIIEFIEDLEKEA